MWQQLELAFELKSNLQDTLDWCRKWLVDFNPAKFHLISFDQFNDTGAIYVKRLLLRKNHVLKCWD